MNDAIKLSYFYGNEADQYSFYKIPKLLFTDDHFKQISVEAKVLYGLMLDRMSLSVKNQWLDSEGRAYIFYSIEDIMENLNCKNNKAITLMKELDVETGIGLIEKKRQGQGKPTIIYVKHFLIESVQKLENPISGKNHPIPEVGKTNVLKCDNQMSRNGEIALLEVGNSHTNKNNINNTNISNIKSNHILSDDENGLDVDEIISNIKTQIDYDCLIHDHKLDSDKIDEIVNLMAEVMIYTGDTMVISSNSYPTQFVQGRFKKLTYSHICYVLYTLSENYTKVWNIKKYLLATLFNAPSTIDHYYQSLVQYDMASGKI